jgi:hypothetical protein
VLDLPGETVTVRRGTPAAPGRRNDTTTDWTDPVDTAVEDCLVAPRSTSENLDGRTGVIIGITVYMPAGSDVAATDRLVIRGDEYDIDGEPGLWTSPGHSFVDGIEVAAKRSEG